MELLSITRASVASERDIYYAGFGSRAAAKLTDLFLLFLVFARIDALFGTSFVTEYPAQGSHRVEHLAVIILFCLYSAAMESSKLQATIGKRAVGIMVTDLDGNRISLQAALLRSIIQCFSLIDYIPALFTRRKQALHDLAADTLVVPGTL